jgi:heat shock protein HslJ
MDQGLRTIGLLLVLALVLVACGTDEPSNDPGEGVAIDGAWVLVAATVDGETLPLDDQWRVTMTIDGSTINGRAACNSYGGTVSIDKGAFSVGDLARTQMACGPAVMEIESKFMRGLSNVSGFTRSDAGASLTGDAVEYTFELLPPVPTAELIGPTWVLDTIIQGEAATSTAATAEPAELVLGTDGTFAGSTGCRDISGEYIVSGDTVHFTSFGADGDCSADLAWQDGQVITVLEGGFTAAIEGDRLTLTGSGGEALSYRAQQ